jgi:outer membrane protein OmpA-like peptidoglycan-associated protein
LTDGEEVKTHHTDPNKTDSDDDGLFDGVEVKLTGTDPNDEDSDDDTLKDGIENPEASGKNPENVTDPLVDTDADGKIDALSPDDDGDGVPTATEIADGAKPGDAGGAPGEDVDGDGRKNWLDPNADGDEIQIDGEEQGDALPRNGVADYLEAAPKGYPDTDKDGLSDEFERGIGSNPKKKDSDDDGITDDVEYGDSVNLMTSPEISAWEDVDGDKKKNWLDTDSDADSLTDGGKAEGRKGEGRVDDDGDGIPAYLDRSSIRITRDGDQIKFDGVINYKKAKADLLPESYPTLYSLSAYLKAHPEITKVTIEGHTSTEGSADYNQGLSDRRAASVREFLIKEGISESIMVSIGYGESHMLVDESKGKTKKEIESLRAKNRRTEFHIEEKMPDTEIILEHTE